MKWIKFVAHKYGIWTCIQLDKNKKKNNNNNCAANENLNLRCLII